MARSVILGMCRGGCGWRGSVRGFEDWATFHAWRKTTATVLDEAGATARMIADQLGHSRVWMTQDVYLGRRSRESRVAAALEGVDPTALGESVGESVGPRTDATT